MAVLRNPEEIVSSPDRNKTELTLRVTEAASNWLLGIGAKAVESEVPVSDKWIADLSAFWIPTPTEAQRYKLIPKKPKWVHWDEPKELREAYNLLHTEYLKAYRNLPDYVAIVHEVKTSANDFKRDDKWNRPQVADMQVLSYVKGTFEPDDYKDILTGWWVLAHSPEDGRLLSVKQRVVPILPVKVEQRLRIIANIAERRHNRTAYQYLRDLQKSQRIEMGERKTMDRLSKCMRAVIDITKGERTVEDCLQSRFRKKIPNYLVEELQKIHGIAKNSA